MSGELVSVIIPVYNGADHLAEALRSVFAQTHRPIEVLVVDDGSTDGSAVVAAGFPEAILIRQENRGVAAARNTALGRARGEFLAFLDQDDAWTPDKLARQLLRLRAHPEEGMAVAREHIWLDAGAAPPPWLRPESLERDLTSHVPGTWLIRRSVFDRLGRFDESYINGSDTDWVYRVREAGIPVGSVEETLLLRRVHAANNSHRMAVNKREIFRALHASLQRRRTAAGAPPP